MTSPAVALAAAVAAYALSVGLAPRMYSRANYRSRVVSLAAGPAAFFVLLVAALLVRLPALLVVVVLAGLAGAYDDLHGDVRAKGLRGHVGALRRGRVTSGLVKLAVLGVAGIVAGGLLHGAGGHAVVTALLVAGLANLVNLFDLRPGRALKVVLLVTLPLVTPAAYAVAGTALGLLPGDVRERTMLGDLGANLLGAAAGVTLADRLPFAGALVALVVVVALTLASEKVSFSRVIEGVPALRWADRLGRTA